MSSVVLWITEHRPERRTVLIVLVLCAVLLVVGQTASPAAKPVPGTLHAHPELISRAELKWHFWRGVSAVLITNAVVVGLVLLNYGARGQRIAALENFLKPRRDREVEVNRAISKLSGEVGIINARLSLPDPKVEDMRICLERMRLQLTALVNDRVRD